jgi:muconolactone delta-isomerase
MLFEVVTRAAPNGIDGETFYRRLAAEGIPYMRSLMERGTIIHSWARIGENGGLNIFSVDSHEQLLQDLYSNPISGHLTFQVTALATDVDLGLFDV